MVDQENSRVVEWENSRVGKWMIGLDESGVGWHGQTCLSVSEGIR